VDSGREHLATTVGWLLSFVFVVALLPP